jgi:hypothetical protein
MMKWPRNRCLTWCRAVFNHRYSNVTKSGHIKSFRLFPPYKHSGAPATLGYESAEGVGIVQGAACFGRLIPDWLD